MVKKKKKHIVIKEIAFLMKVKCLEEPRKASPAAVIQAFEDYHDMDNRGYTSSLNEGKGIILPSVNENTSKAISLRRTVIKFLYLQWGEKKSVR